MSIRKPLLLALAALLPSMGLDAASPVPLELERPDGQPGDASRPVKVYLLAGQSNMVGMGNLSSSRPLYPSIFLSADRAILPGLMPIGGSALAAHGIFQSEEAGAEEGAVFALYEGSYGEDINYGELAAVETGTLALGRVAAMLPALDGDHVVVAKAFLEVPETGLYTLHAGYGESTYAIVKLGGSVVYRKLPGGLVEVEEVELAAGGRHGMEITYLRGGSAAFWLERVGLEGRGDLVSLTQKEGKYPYLLDGEGNWTVRQDVYYQEARLAVGGKGSALSASSNGAAIGPELGFGFVMGSYHDEQVLLIKTAQGNRSLGFDFRPPSSGRTEPDNDYESAEYELMVKGMRETLDRIAEIVPGYAGQGYEIAGFGWFQGHKDGGATKEEYEGHLVNLIKDLRAEFDLPEMPAVVATVGFDGYLMAEDYRGVWEAQMAVGDPEQHPEFAGNVASVDTRDFWREVEESPQPQGHHYHRNAETYLLIGEAMGRAMVRLAGGEAEEMPVSDREVRAAERAAAEAARPVPGGEQVAASLAAARPMVLDGALVRFTSDPRHAVHLAAALRGERPEKVNPLLDDLLDQAADHYRAVGIGEYDWKVFGEDLRGAEWEYHAFDLASVRGGVGDLGGIVPGGMEGWNMPGFDAEGAGWKVGAAPFGGARTDADAPPTPEWYTGPGRGKAATEIENEVLLMRKTVELPPLKEGHRYRIRVGGSVRANSGDGYAIYVNGRLLAESRGGIVAWRREGWRPRGGMVWADFWDEFGGGEVTLAVANFPMDNRPEERFIPAGESLRVWVEEMKLPGGLVLSP